jgi:subtilisin family serine protease
VFNLGTNFQGVAPDANIVAAQVFSYDQNRQFAPQAITADLVAAMQAVASAITPGTNDNPFVVNLSLGSGMYSSSTSCNSVSLAFRTAVNTLLANGVPVVAATGNGGNSGKISWPACIDGVIKVGSTTNDGAGTTISSFTNRPDMASGGFPNSDVFMVPGGQIVNGDVTSVVGSAVPDFSIQGANQDGVGGMAGTSQATPHVAGLYALYKSLIPTASVQEATAWFQEYAGFEMTPVCSSGACRPYYRIRLP